MNDLTHPFDLELGSEEALDLFAEELPEQIQLASDCASTALSASCCSTTASAGTMGSIISTGSKPK
jgi:diacylglycerol kinase